MDNLPKDLQRRVVDTLCADDAARLGCTNRFWRLQTAEHPMLRPPLHPETPQKRVMQLIEANQPWAISRFLMTYSKDERHDILNRTRECGLTPLMYMATLWRLTGGGISLASALCGMGAYAKLYEAKLQAVDYAVDRGNLKLAVWLQMASEIPRPPRAEIFIREATRCAVPHLIRMAKRPPDPGSQLLGHVFEGDYNIGAERIIQTWEALLEIYPQWRHRGMDDATAYELLRATLRRRNALPLLRYLYEQGILAKAMRHGDLLREALRERQPCEVLRYLVEDAGTSLQSAQPGAPLVELVFEYAQRDTLLYFLEVGDTALDVKAASNRLLQVAVDYGNTEAVDVLLEQGGDLKIPSTSGTSLLHAAMLGADVKMYQHLKAAGAEFSPSDPLRQTLLDICQTGYSTDVEMEILGKVIEIIETHPWPKAERREMKRALL